MAGRLDEAWRTIGGLALSVLGVCVLLFTLVGVIQGGGDAAPEVADAPVASASPAATSIPDAGEGTSATGGAATPSGSGTMTASPSSRGASGAASDSPSTSPSPSEPTVDPSDVTVQVLDGDGIDDRAPVDRVVAELEEAGYDIVVVNPAARRYDTTTVMWSDGRQTAAEELADAFGFAEVREAASNLSNSVWVHVVVGEDASG